MTNFFILFLKFSLLPATRCLSAGAPASGQCDARRPAHAQTGNPRSNALIRRVYGSPPLRGRKIPSTRPCTMCRRTVPLRGREIPMQVIKESSDLGNAPAQAGNPSAIRRRTEKQLRPLLRRVRAERTDHPSCPRKDEAVAPGTRDASPRADTGSMTHWRKAPDKKTMTGNRTPSQKGPAGTMTASGAREACRAGRKNLCGTRRRDTTSERGRGDASPRRALPGGKGQRMAYGGYRGGGKCRQIEGGKKR